MWQMSLKIIFIESSHYQSHLIIPSPSNPIPTSHLGDLI